MGNVGMAAPIFNQRAGCKWAANCKSDDMAVKETSRTRSKPTSHTGLSDLAVSTLHISKSRFFAQRIMTKEQMTERYERLN
jgi:hypothetical protein